MEENKYISLQEAIKYCHYSQEYLSLRARQGKLKSVKFGRNWVTKREWLEEYLEKAKEYNNKINGSVEVRPQSALRLEKVNEVQPQSQPAPQFRFGFVLSLVFVLLTTGIAFDELNLGAKKSLNKFSSFVSGFNKSFNGFFAGYGEGFKNGFQDFDSFAAEFSENFDRGAGLVLNQVKHKAQDLDNFAAEFGEETDNFFGNAGKEIKNYALNLKEGTGIAFQEINIGAEKVKGGTGIFLSEIGNAIKTAQMPKIEIAEPLKTAKAFLSWLGEGIKSIPQKLVEGLEKGYNKVHNFTKQKLSELAEIFKPEKIVQEPIAQFTKEGIIVIPSTEKDEELKKKIEKAFSDEVKVEPGDETSGIIIPVFKEREGEKYLYILVPIKNEN